MARPVFFAFFALAASVVVPGLAHAEDTAGNPRAMTGVASAPREKPAKGPRPVRSGAVLALTLDSMLGSASGYPNDSKLLNDPKAYGRTGPRTGGGFTLSVGGALAPYLNVGFFLSVNAASSKESWSFRSGGGGMRVDAFPLAFTHKRWVESLAIYGLAGLGSVHVEYAKPGTHVANLDGTQSLLGIGAFYEFRFGAFGIGPEARFDAVVSRTASRIAVLSSLRLSFYPSRLF